MEDQSHRDKILDRVAKAQALAESERKLGHLDAAENAAAVASKLMTQYGITMESVRARESGREKPDILPFVPGAAGVKMFAHKVPWLQVLGGVVARAFNCRLLIPNNEIHQKYGYNTFVFMGFEAERKQAAYAYGVLTQAIDDTVDKEYRRAYHAARYAGYNIKDTDWRGNWIAGAISGLIDKFEAERKAAMQESGDEQRAIILINRQLAKVDEALKDVPSMEMPSLLDKDKLNAAALEAGMTWGRNVNIAQGLETKTTKTLPTS